MPDALFDDLPILEELGASLRAAMAAEEAGAAASATQAAARRRRPRFGWLGSFLVLGLVGTAAAAGTLTVLRGSPIPGPSARDTQPSMTPKRESLRVLDLRAPDPAGSSHLPFALRVGESEAGQVCATVGQADGDDFGIVGTDGVFRGLAPTIVDGCGDRNGSDAAVIGARVFAADRWDDVRTVVYGTGLPDRLRSAVLTVRRRQQPVELEGGSFAVALRGYPEDSGTTIALRLEGGRTVRHSWTSPRFVLDPDGPAWQIEPEVIGGDRNRQALACDRLTDVRVADTGYTSTPRLCERLRRPRSSDPRSSLRLAIGTFRPGDAGGSEISKWRWSRSSTRTIVWGHAMPRVARRVVLTAPGVRMESSPSRSGAVGFVLPGAVALPDVRVRVASPAGPLRDVRLVPTARKAAQP